MLLITFVFAAMTPTPIFDYAATPFAADTPPFTPCRHACRLMLMPLQRTRVCRCQRRHADYAYADFSPLLMFRQALSPARIRAISAPLLPPYFSPLRHCLFFIAIAATRAEFSSPIDIFADYRCFIASISIPATLASCR
jgi:hypothetical protein